MMELEVSCAGPSGVVYDRTLTEYDFGPDHPMRPLRVDLTMKLADQLGVLNTSNLQVLPAPHATDEDLITVHSPALIEAVQKASVDPDADWAAFGLGTDDDPIFPRMHVASRHVVGASLEAVRQVWSGNMLHAANISGGLHHALPTRASGFCVYNDIAVAIKWLLAQGVQRVAYVDVDVHHGDGVEHVFYDDPRVLTISLHETGQVLFPGTGFPKDNGGPEAPGTAVNVALPPGTGDSGWLRAFHAVVPPLVREFKPEVLLTQHGCDSHRDDPLADLMLSVDGHRSSYLTLHSLAHEVCGGKWVSFGGGGYAVTSVVPRSWTHLLAIVGGKPLDTNTLVSRDWREEVSERYQSIPPDRMGDGREPQWRDWTEGYDPQAWIDRAILTAREAVFPLHGLDPMP